MIRFTMPPAALPLAPLLVLAACSQAGAPTPADQAPGPAADAPTPTPSAAPATARAIPERFRGMWDNAGGSCEPPSDMHMEIGAVSIEFYESLGTVTGVSVESPDRITVNLAMEGEGERWEVTNRLTLSQDGAALTVADISDTSGVAVPRKRCS